MTSKKDVLSETFIWEGKEENEEPENRESIEIILARGVMNTRVMMKEGDEEVQIVCMSEVMGGWTEAFETLFENQKDEDFVREICMEIEQNLISEVKDLGEEMLTIFEHMDMMDALPEICPAELEVRYLLTSDNDIRVEVGNEFLDRMMEVQLEDPEIDEELAEALHQELVSLLEAATKLYVIYRGELCRRKWELAININFEDPEKFRELKEEQQEEK